MKNFSITSLSFKHLSASPLFKQKHLKISNSAFTRQFSPIFLNPRKLSVYSTGFSKTNAAILSADPLYNNIDFDVYQQINDKSKVEFYYCRFHDIHSTSASLSLFNCQDIVLYQSSFVNCVNDNNGLIFVEGGKVTLTECTSLNCFAKICSFIETKNANLVKFDMNTIVNTSPALSPSGDFTNKFDCSDLEFTNINATSCFSFNNGAVMGMSASKNSVIKNCFCMKDAGSNLFFIDSQVDTNIMEKIIFISCKAQQGLISTKSTWFITDSVFYNTKGDFGSPIYSTLTIRKCFYNTQTSDNPKVKIDDCVNSIVDLEKLLEGRTGSFVYVNEDQKMKTEKLKTLPKRTAAATKINTSTYYMFHSIGIWVMVLCVVVLAVMVWFLSNDIRRSAVSANNKELIRQYKKDVEANGEEVYDEDEEIDFEDDHKFIFAD